MNRLTNSQYYTGSTHTGTLDEAITYDNMGNITQLTRGSYGTQSYVYSGTFAYSYNGNQVSSITDNGNAYNSYTYDANGNVLTGGNYSYDYNMLNLPNDVKLNGTVFNTYTYDAAGNKLRKVSTASGITNDYIDGIQWKNGAIEFIQTEEGRYENSASPVYQYDLKDHLGNNRVLIQKNTASTATAQQVNEYYAFGLNVADYDNSTTNKYLYNNKELQSENNLNQYDYGARFYDPVIGRFTTIDPEAEDFEHLSPYNYAVNNPISMIDPDGMYAEEANTTDADKPKPKPKPIELKEVKVTAKKTHKDNQSTVIVFTPAMAAANRAQAWRLISKYTPLGKEISVITTLLDLTSKPLKFESPVGKVTRLSAGEIKKLKEKGFDPHENKPKQGGSGGKIDLWKDTIGNLFFRSENGSNYEPLYENIHQILK